MTQFERFFFSTKTMTVLLFVFASSMAIATFVETTYDTSTAKMLIYNATWFETLMLWLIMIFIYNIKIYHLTKKEKRPVLAFHIAFILMFFGGAITRYCSFEGQMFIQEGETSNEIISDLTYIKVNISNGAKSITYDQYPYIMSYLNKEQNNWLLKRSFKKKYDFDNTVIKIRSLDYIPLAKDSIQKTTFGRKAIAIITTGQNGRENNYIFDGEIKTFGGILFSFNKPFHGAVQLVEIGDSIMINFPVAAQYISMQGQQAGSISDTVLLAQHTGTIKENKLTALGFRTLYSINNTRFVIPNPSFVGKIIYYSGNKGNITDRTLLNMVKLEISSGDEKDTVWVKGGKNVTNYSAKSNIHKLGISVGYGSKLIKTPFLIRCDDFKLERYPGSSNASSYESRVTVIDNKKETPHHIFMNNVMDYGGYRFFQSSYFPDESGTILSVNKDWWGTRITYSSYFLLFLGMFLTLFKKQTRIQKLNLRLKNINRKVLLLVPLTLILSFTNAQDSVQQEIDTLYPQKDTELFVKQGELGGRVISTSHADKFGHLLVQDFQGRIKPMDTQTLELLRKIYKKDTYNGLSPVQWFLSMQLDPTYWLMQPMIYVGAKGGDELFKETGANVDGYTTFTNLTDRKGEFKLQNQYKISFSKPKAEQSNYDKEVINLIERYSIFANIIYGYFTRIIPVKNDLSHTWRSWIYSSQNNPAAIDSTAYAFISLYFDNIKQDLQTGNWETANEILANISSFQKKWSKDIIPSDAKISLEILYNL